MKHKLQFLGMHKSRNKSNVINHSKIKVERKNIEDSINT